MKITDDVREVLSKSRIEGNVLYLPDVQLERKLYQSVNKVLEILGGTWNRKVKGHIFDYNPEEAVDAALILGEIVDKQKVFQFFETPKSLAAQICDMAEINENSTVLEPECGKGRIADEAYSRNPARLLGIELNTDMDKYLADKPYETIIGQDFLEYSTDEQFDRIVMNPPFANHQDIKHVMKAFEMLQPGGILVSVMSVSPLFRTDKMSEEFREFLDANNAFVERLPEDAFKESGTMVKTCVVKIKKGERT